MKTLITSILIAVALVSVTNCTTEVHQDAPPQTTTTTTKRTTLTSPYLDGGTVQTQTTQSY